jgi:hypothetical protein
MNSVLVDMNNVYLDIAGRIISLRKLPDTKLLDE